MKNIIYLVVSLLVMTTTVQNLSAQEYARVIEVKTAPLKMLLGGVGVSTDFCINDNFSVESNIQFKNRKIIERKVLSLQGFGKYYFNSKMGADRFYAGVYLKAQNRTFDIDIRDNRIAMGVITGYKIVSKAGVVVDFTGGFGRNLYSNITTRAGNSQASTVGVSGVLGFDYISRLSVGYRFGTTNESSSHGKLQRKAKGSNSNKQVDRRTRK